MMMTARGKIQRVKVSDFNPIGRNTQGVRIMNLHDGDKIASIAKIANEDEPETAASDTPASEAEPQTESPKTDETPPA